MNLLRINCGGEIFITYRETIEKLPNCPLKICILDERFNQGDEIFIDISPRYFKYMLEFLRNEMTCYDIISHINTYYTDYVLRFMGWDIIEKTILDTIPPDLEWYDEKYTSEEFNLKRDEVIRQYHNLFDVKINKDDINHVCREINKKMIWIPDPKKMDSYVSQINGKVKELELKITFDELMALPNIILA